MFRVVKKNPMYNQTSHAFEFYWSPTSVFVDVEDNGAYPKIEFNFVPLADVARLDLNNLVGKFIKIMCNYYLSTL